MGEVMREEERQTADAADAPIFRLALENTSNELETRLVELGQMARIGKLFASSSRLDEVAARGLEILLDATPAENGSIMLYFKEGDDLCMLAAGTRSGRMSYYGPDGHPLRLFTSGEGLAGTCLAQARPIIAPDVANEPLFKHGVGKVEIGSIACLPLFVDGRPLGVVNLSHPESGRLKAENAGAWALLVGYLAVALSNAMLLVRLRQTNDRLQVEVDNRTRSLREANVRLKAAQDRIALHNEELKLKVEERSSELKNALLTLTQRTGSLERANRIKDEFLNNINHELKTPLNAIIGYSGLLLREALTGLTPEQKADLEVIESNGRHLQQIIDNILALREIEGGNVTPECSRSDLSQLLAMAVASVAPRARAKGITALFETPANPPISFLFDPTLVRRVVYNLLDNAIKFSSRGKIRVSMKEEKGIDDDASLVRVLVEDEGMGVKPQDAERIFMKFQQAEPSMRKQEGGSGVGLAIAKTLVELHGGSITYQPSSPAGSIFSFTLPVRR